MTEKTKKFDDIIALDRVTPTLPVWDWSEVMAKVYHEGLVLELGVYAGASFHDICRAIAPRKAYGFDWFWGLTEDWGWEGTAGASSLGGQPPECPKNGEFVIGRVEETLPKFLSEKQQKVAFCHFDMDTYTPTRLALFAMDKNFFPGSIIAFDEIDGDMQQTTARNLSDEQRAFREWVAETERDYEVIGRRHRESLVFRVL